MNLHRTIFEIYSQFPTWAQYECMLRFTEHAISYNILFYIKSRVLSIHNLHVWFTSNGYEWIKYWWRGGYHPSNVDNSRDMQYVLMFVISLLCCSRSISILRFICLWETSDDYLKMAGDFEPCRYNPGIQEDVLDLCYCKRWCWSSEWDANRRILHREAHLPWGSAYCSKESQ